MGMLRKTISGILIAAAVSVCGIPAPAQDAGRELRIGLIGADPAQLLQDFDPFVEYLKSGLKRSGVRDVSVFVAKDLDQLRGRVREREIDLVFASAFPALELEHDGFAPAVTGVRGTVRECSAVFFVRRKGSLRALGDLRGRTIAFGTPSSTAGYALARAELKRSDLTIREFTDIFIFSDAVRYEFAGEPVNQAFRVIRNQADAGVFCSSDWEALSGKERSRLRIVHRTTPVVCLLGSFHHALPRGLRSAVESTLVGMSDNRKGRAALASALRITRFERLTRDDTRSLQRFQRLLSAAE